MDHHIELVDELLQFLDVLQQTENADGCTSLILKYGRDFRPLEKAPPWLQAGKPRQCFRNATLQAITRTDVLYAEGYAYEPELPIPVQHAWLVDKDGYVVDPTWQITKRHVYFGITFSRKFVAETLNKNNGEAGILVNLHLLRQRFGIFGQVEKSIEAGSVQFARLKATDRPSGMDQDSRQSSHNRRLSGRERN